MKLSLPSALARKLSRRPSSGKNKKLDGTEAPSFASASSSSSASDDGDALAMARSVTTPRSVIPAEISRQELEAVLRRLGLEEPSEDEVDAVAALAAAGEAGEEDLVEAFKVFDADGDGRITAEELRGVMVGILGADGRGCSIDDCRRMIGGVDADGDGFVGFQDFARMMMMTTTTATAGAGASVDGHRLL